MVSLPGNAGVLRHPTPESIRKAQWVTCVDSASDRRFLWNEVFHYSAWEEDLFPSDDPAAPDNDAIWAAFVSAQERSVFQHCAVCFHEIDCREGMICDDCGKLAHKRCGGARKSICRYCSPKHSMCLTVGTKDDQLANSQKVNFRVASLLAELSDTLLVDFRSVLSDTTAGEAQKRTRLQNLVTGLFQRNFRDFRIQPIPAKANTLGVLATTKIEPFTIVGRYPGYPDLFCPEHCKYGRALPRYSLNGINCADFANTVFEEFRQTSAPFINEPSESERANCGWIVEQLDDARRYSVMTIRGIEAGEELLIGYGPSFLREYGFTYDHFVFLHSKDNLYDLYHWPCSRPETAQFVCGIAYDPKEDVYRAVGAM